MSPKATVVLPLPGAPMNAACLVNSPADSDTFSARRSVVVPTTSAMGGADETDGSIVPAEPGATLDAGAKRRSVGRAPSLVLPCVRGPADDEARVNLSRSRIARSEPRLVSGRVCVCQGVKVAAAP